LLIIDIKQRRFQLSLVVIDRRGTIYITNINQCLYLLSPVAEVD